MGVINTARDWVVKLFERRIPEVPASPQNTAMGRQRDSSPATDRLNIESVSNDKHSRHQEIKQMVENDPRWDRILYKLASDASYKSFTVTVESADGKRQQKQAQAVIDRTRFLIEDKKKIRGWIKGLLRDGDLFLQLIVEDRELVKAKKLAAEITHTRMNAEGEFPPDKKPYYQQSKWSPYEAEREFEEWEIVHLKWDSEDGQKYGKSLLNSSRLAWRRLESGEKDIAIRRKMRAGLRQHHKIGTDKTPGSPKDIDEYQLRNKATFNNPTDPAQNIYSNHLVDIKTLEGDETIGEIEDLKWIEGLFTIASGIPQALLSGGGREAATNLNVIKEQEEDYLRVIGDIDEVMEEAFRRIFDIALLLAGINPDAVVYVFNWGAKDREDTDKKVQRAERMLTMGYSFETVFKTVDLDGVTYEEELERIQCQVDDGFIPYRGAMVRGLQQETLASISAAGNMTNEEKKISDGQADGEDNASANGSPTAHPSGANLLDETRNLNGNGKRVE